MMSDLEALMRKVSQYQPNNPKLYAIVLLRHEIDTGFTAKFEVRDKEYRHVCDEIIGKGTTIFEAFEKLHQALEAWKA